MNGIIEAIGRLLSSWTPWVVVAPWEEGVRVRGGKVATRLKPGFHLRIPVLDRVALVNTRLRVTTTTTVTLRGERPGWATARGAIIGFRIDDPLKAMLRYNNPHVSVCGYVQAQIAKGVSAADCRATVQREQLEDSGIHLEFVEYNDDVEVRALRLLQGSWSIEAVDQQHGNEPVVRY